TMRPPASKQRRAPNTSLGSVKRDQALHAPSERISSVTDTREREVPVTLHTVTYAADSLSPLPFPLAPLYHLPSPSIKRQRAANFAALLPRKKLITMCSVILLPLADGRASDYTVNKEFHHENASCRPPHCPRQIDG